MEARDSSALISSALLNTVISGSSEIIESNLRKRVLSNHKHRCDEILKSFSEIKPDESVRVITSVIYEILTNASTEEILSRIALKTRGEAYSVSSRILAIDYIKAGAGNGLMKDLFNYSCKTCQKERKEQNVCFTGRYKNLNEEQANNVIKLYECQEIKQASDFRSVVYAIREATCYNINSIYKFLTEYQEQKEIVEKIKGERLNERNRNWF
ncbi:hypothetical protein [Motilimonas cestriensis]|uniref:hypothetical protein n=1 Tax=Motilimonas cestriensis TaxID=2742685 RepID=UPI003DA4277A